MILTTYLQEQGIDLRPAGRGRMKGLCPFHVEQHPSFHIYEGRDGHERFKCYGCGAHGDLIDAIRGLENKSYKEAVDSIGGDLLNSKQIQKARRKAQRLREFGRWEARYSSLFGLWLRSARRLLDTMTSIDELSDIQAEAICNIPYWDWQLEILSTRDNKAKWELFKALMEVDQDENPRRRF